MLDQDDERDRPTYGKGCSKESGDMESGRGLTSVDAVSVAETHRTICRVTRGLDENGGYCMQTLRL